MKITARHLFELAGLRVPTSIIEGEDPHKWDMSDAVNAIGIARRHTTEGKNSEQATIALASADKLIAARDYTGAYKHALKAIELAVGRSHPDYKTVTRGVKPK
jgi:hypothetical protein